MYVASPHARGGVYVYKTTDDGRHWHSTGAQGAGWMSDILSLTSDPRHPGTLYAGTDTAVYKTVDGGRTWRPFNQGLFPPQGGRHVCYGPAGVGRRYCVKLPFGVPGTTSWHRNNGWVLDVAVDPVHSSPAARRRSQSNTRPHLGLCSADNGGTVSRIAVLTRPVTYAIAHDPPPAPPITSRRTRAGRSRRPVRRLAPQGCWDSMDAPPVDCNPQTLYAQWRHRRDDRRWCDLAVDDQRPPNEWRHLARG